MSKEQIIAKMSVLLEEIQSSYNLYPDVCDCGLGKNSCLAARIQTALDAAKELDSE